MERSMPRRLPIILLTLMAVVVVAGCGAAPATPAEVAAPPATQAPPPQAQTAAPSEMPAKPEAASTPTARAGLEATDPTGVALASGKPALVEFFAFW
jgi:multidrug efflux pump subunit AcrA (membrane-fusion protein)